MVRRHPSRFPLQPRQLRPAPRLLRKGRLHHYQRKRHPRSPLRYKSFADATPAPASSTGLWILFPLCRADFSDGAARLDVDFTYDPCGPRLEADRQLIAFHRFLVEADQTAFGTPLAPRVHILSDKLTGGFAIPIRVDRAEQVLPGLFAHGICTVESFPCEQAGVAGGHRKDSLKQDQALHSLPRKHSLQTPSAPALRLCHR